MGEVLDNVGHRGLHYRQDSGSSVFRSTLLHVSVESYPCKGGCCSSGLYLYEHKTILKRRASLIQTIRQKSLTSHIKPMKTTSLPESIPGMRKFGTRTVTLHPGCGVEGVEATNSGWVNNSAQFA